MSFNRLIDRKSATASPPEFKVYCSADPFERTIPRKLWMYWDQYPPPLLIRTCVDAARSLNPDFEVNLLHPGNLHEFIDKQPPELSTHTVQKQANWYRLYLLNKYGGIWIDASTILNRNLDWVLEVQQAQRSELVGFYIQKKTTKSATPVLGNWFLAAVPGSPFIAEWFRTFTEEVVIGGIQAYLEKLRRNGTFDELVQAIKWPDYLVMHVLAQELIQGGFPARLSLARAEDCAYLYHVQTGRKHKKLLAELMFKPAAPETPYLVKLRGSDRRNFELYMSAGVYLSNSVVGTAVDKSGKLFINSEKGSEHGPSR